ncbi:hypothetical protein B9G98_03508 [Wickerhamiella sorbophila]|uniref:Uncharacterized protein n=1 Tax=Wickerhamiella sorbophila TaxID=45607 RepID=A0A2T0FLL7_9ASCO|nr:hypothetical protein B9G98_03508 [Wickerhamiella sorbophila]PRT55888.1 hypothetical protein B9G98_03508 [Wickerhamiella sorbophila]
MQRLQEQLDLQWDYLEARDVRIHEVRKAIGEILSDMAIDKEQAAADIEHKLHEASIEAQRQNKVAERRTVLNKELDSLMQTNEASKLTEIKKSLADIDRQIVELKQKRAQARQELAELESVFGARKARITSQLDALPPHNANVVKDEQLLLTKLEETKSELEATNEGSRMWESVIKYLDALDTKMQGPPVQIVSALEEAVAWLTEKGTFAASKHWGPLIVAIGHELEIVKEALDAIKQVNL